MILFMILSVLDMGVTIEERACKPGIIQAAGLLYVVLQLFGAVCSGRVCLIRRDSPTRQAYPSWWTLLLDFAVFAEVV